MFLFDVMKDDIQEIDEAASGGLIVTVDPDTAEGMGAFEDDALSFDEAQLSLLDVNPLTNEAIEGGFND